MHLNNVKPGGIWAKDDGSRGEGRTEVGKGGDANEVRVKGGLEGLVRAIRDACEL